MGGAPRPNRKIVVPTAGNKQLKIVPQCKFIAGGKANLKVGGGGGLSHPRNPLVVYAQITTYRTNGFRSYMGPERLSLIGIRWNYRKFIKAKT